MRRLARRSAAAVIALTAIATSSVAMAAAAPASTRKWTKISTNTGLSIASAGLLRTADGKLHVVWPRNDGANGYSLHYSTVGGKARLLATGSIVSHWGGVGAYPRLVPGPSGGIRLIFPGGNGQGGSPFNLGAMYTATSGSAGNNWSLIFGSLSHSTSVPLTDDAATAESNGTPVAAWPAGNSIVYHVGVDAAIPAAAPDKQLNVGSGGATGTALATAKNGSVSVAWFDSSGQADQGYWVDQLLPSKQAKVKAPGSGGKNLPNNQPFQSVALAARGGGGVYLAYCAPTKTVECGHVALWRVGARKAQTAPRSSTGTASHVAIAPAPGGHLWILWYDTALNKIRVVRTNATGTRFGQVLTISGPPKTGEFDGLQAEGSKGPLDVVALVQQNTNKATPSYWDTQLLPALKLTSSKSSVSHKHSTTITFTVTDVGDPVSGAKVRFLGKTVTTNAKGVARIAVPKGTSAGQHTATATKASYTAASFTVKVT